MACHIRGEVHYPADAALGWYQVTMYYDCYLRGDYEGALEFRRLHPDQKAIDTYIEYIPVYGHLGSKQEALENWRKLLAEDPSWTAESFKSWYHRLSMPDEDIAKLMDGIYKSGVLGAGDAWPVTRGDTSAMGVSVARKKIRNH
jgi:hypothetical protein